MISVPHLQKSNEPYIYDGDPITPVSDIVEGDQSSPGDEVRSDSCQWCLGGRVMLHVMLRNGKTVIICPACLELAKRFGSVPND